MVRSGAGQSAAAHATAAADARQEAAVTRPADDPVAANRAVAVSPAVGYFRPRPDLVAGARVRAGDRLGVVDVLGVAQEVVAPADGIVGATLVEAGEPVEYGQEIVEIEFLDRPVAGRAPAERGEDG